MQSGSCWVTLTVMVILVVGSKIAFLAPSYKSRVLMPLEQKHLKWGKAWSYCWNLEVLGLDNEQV